MKIAIVGAGALGRIYGVRLAARHEVVFVVRPARLGETEPFRVEHAVPLGAAHAIRAPRRVDSIPVDCDAAIVTLRFDTIVRADDDLRRALAAPPRTLVVCLSPVFDAQRRTLDDVAGHPVVPALPGVSGYVDGRGVVRYWVPPVAPTLIDDGAVRWRDLPRSAGAREDRASREGLVRALEEVRLPARLARDVAAVDAATTVSFFPAIAAVCAGGGLAGLAADPALLAIVVAAGHECARLAPHLGEPAPWAPLFQRLFAPAPLRASLAVGRLLASEPIRFVDEHFGPKLRDQHLAMGDEVAALASAQGVPTPALEALLARVRAR